MLTVDASDLHIVLLSNLVELLLLSHQLWKLDVDRSAHGSSQVRWARGDVSKMFVMSKLKILFNLSGSSLQSAENFLDISTVLHRNDSKLILFVDPDEESLVVVVEDTSARWPVSVQVSCCQESVSFPIIWLKKINMCQNSNLE